MDDMGIAERVVISHLCHCTDAARKAREEGTGSLCEASGHDATEHKFTVDGEDFPWYITERGPLVERLADDLYAVDIEIMGICKDRNDKGYHEMLGIEYEIGAGAPFRPVIGGKPFPWTCTDDVMTLRFCHKMIPTMHLKFLARDVDAKGIEIEDKRPVWDGKALYRAGGDLIRGGKDKCYECGDWVDQLFDHYQEKHPQKRGVRVS